MQRVFLSALSTCFVLALCSSLATTTAIAETADASTDHPQLAQDASSQMSRWLNASQPGAEHARLDELVGQYSIAIRAWLVNSEQPPIEAEGKAEYRWLLGGRWLQQSLSSRLMGLPFDGLGMLGYDRVNDHYASYWQDSLSTATRSSFGEFDEDSQLIMQGTADDPATGAMNQPIRYEISFGGDQGHQFRAYDLSRPDGGQLVMEITYTRIKPEDNNGLNGD